MCPPGDCFQVNRLQKLLNTFDVKASGKWIVLSILVGVVAGVGAILFHLAGQIVTQVSLVHFAEYAPREAMGEHSVFGPHGETAGEALTSSPWLIVGVMTGK